MDYFNYSPYSSVLKDIKGNKHITNKNKADKNK